MSQPTDLHKLSLMLYAIYAASAVLQFFEETVLMGLMILIVAYIAGNMHKKQAVGTPYASHLRWLDRTMWIGSGVIVPIAAAIAISLIAHYTNYGPVLASMSEGDPDAMTESLKRYMLENEGKVTLITLAAMAPTAVWWIRRCWVGFVLARAGKPVEKVTSWL